MIYTDKMPIQMFTDRICKYKSWARVSTTINHDAKTIDFDVMTAANATTKKTISYKDAAKLFGWKDVDLESDKLYAIPTLEAETYDKPISNKTLDKDNPDHIINEDKHFGEAGYCWMSETRITNPMNADTEGIAEINAKMRSGSPVYTTVSGPIGIKLAEKFDNDNE